MADTVLEQLLPRCDVLVDRDTHGAVVPLSRRRGVMVHFDDSSSDRGALSWFRDPEFRLSYNRAYRDDGTRIRITPSVHHAAYHAGVCLPEDGIPTQELGGTTFRYGGANTGYFGLAITAAANEHITLEQLDALTTDIAIIFRAAGWSPDDVDDRIVGHDSRAIFNPRDNPKEPQLWGKLGRKIDPTGFNVSDPVIDMGQLREGVRTYLLDPTSPIWAGWPS
jgi:hypothetical protein